MKTNKELPPVVVIGNGIIEEVHPGSGKPVVIDLDALDARPSNYAVGVDNDAILGSFETLGEALESARRALAEGDHWRIDLELQDRELNPPHADSEKVAIYVLYCESEEEDEEDLPEEIE